MKPKAIDTLSRTAQFRLWLVKRERKKLRRRKRVEGRDPAYVSQPRRFLVNDHTRNSVTATRDRKLIIELPEILDLENNFEITTSHFETLRKAARGTVAIRHLRFDKIRSISPSAALVLASEVDRWNQKLHGRLKAAVDSWDGNIKRLLCQMGYFELLGLVRPDGFSTTGNTTFLPFKRGEVSSKNSGELAKQLRREIEALVGFSIKKHFLFEGLSEAITNVGQHAYGEVHSFTVKQWWLSGSYDAREKLLCVTFYDQGDGIPVTLPTWDFFEAIKLVFHGWKDSEKIEAAMQTGRSATRLEERGKGLQNLIEFAQAHREGTLSIFSLRGMYRLSFSKKGDQQEMTSSRRDYETSIGGTLIEWSVKL